MINKQLSTYRFIISSAISLMYPPSMRPGVSIMFNVKPALDRDTITGLGPSDFATKEQHHINIIV